MKSLASFSDLTVIKFPTDYGQLGPCVCLHDAEDFEYDLVQADWKDEQMYPPVELKDPLLFWDHTSVEPEEGERIDTHAQFLLSGLLVARPTVRRFAEHTKDDWIDLARQLPMLERIEWTLHRGLFDPVGTVNWQVVRRRTGEATLYESEPDPDLDEWICVCEDRGPEAYLVEEYLWGLPPLFKQDANFTPAFTLDRFVSRS